MEIRREGDLFVIPCREWAAQHMQMDIAYQYKTRRNALRATQCRKRNKTSRLCFYTKQLYTRVVRLELIIANLNKQLDAYSFSEDAWEPVSDGGSAVSDDKGTSGIDSLSGDAAEVSSGTGGTPGRGVVSADAGVGVAVGSSSNKSAMAMSAAPTAGMMESIYP